MDLLEIFFKQVFNLLNTIKLAFQKRKKLASNCLLGDNISEVSKS